LLASYPKIVKINLKPILYSNRLIKEVDRVGGFEPTTSSAPNADGYSIRHAYD